MTGTLSTLTPVACNVAAIEALVRHGAALVACKGKMPDHWTASIAKLMQPIASQIRVFSNRHNWRTVGVNTEKQADRSEGIGESPLHMDFVNAEFPPDYVVLLCVRTDPTGGGQSTLASMTDALQYMSQEEREQLKARQFMDGKVEGLENVGKDINPFPILSVAGDYKFRYTAQLLKGAYSESTLAAVRHFHAELESRRISFLIHSGHALIIDQRRYVHGKLALGGAQETLLPDQRRKLLHGFFRSNPPT